MPYADAYEEVVMASQGFAGDRLVTVNEHLFPPAGGAAMAPDGPYLYD